MVDRNPARFLCTTVPLGSTNEATSRPIANRVRTRSTASLIQSMNEASRRTIATSRRTRTILQARLLRAALLLLPLLALLQTHAQPVPKLNSLSPQWVQHGTTTEISFSGDNLTNATGLLFSSDPDSHQSGIAATGLKIKDDKALTAKITVVADAAPGEREVRVVTPSGVSEPLVLNVSDLPEVHQSGTNTSPENAQRVEFPAAINGRIKEPAEVDYYRFHAKQGDELVFDVYASRMGSPLDSSLAVLNTESKELARNEDANGLDSLIEFSVPDEGDYLLQLRDFRYQGGEDFKYRLYGGALPHLDWIFPLGAQRGQSVEITLSGRNLGSSSNLTHNVDPKAPLGVTEINARAAGHLSNPKSFDVGDLPEFMEIEPNDTAEKANTVPVPITINGRIAGLKDVDVFRFKSDKDQRLLCEVNAQHLGSSLDALLTLADAKGKVLAQNDDAEGMDARIDYDKFAKDQEYTLSIRDLNERDGDKFSYRLSIHPPVPDFSVRFFPDIPRLNRGGHAWVRCEVTRLGGFDGPVRASFQGLPPGVYGQPLVLTKDIPATGLMVISAATDAALGHFPIKLSATAVIKGNAVSHLAEPIIPGQKPRQSRRGSRSADDRALDDAFLTVLDTPPFLLDLLSLAAEADQDQTTAIEVEAERSSGFTNDIELTAEGYSLDRGLISNHVEVAAVTLKGGQSRAKVSLKAKAGAQTGTRTIVIKGDTLVNGYTNTQYTQTIPLTIRQIPFALASSLPRLSVTALPPETKSAAGEAGFSVKADRRAGFNGEIALSLEGLPDGINATIDKIAAGQTEATVRLTASTNAPVGKEISFTCLGVGLFNDRNYKHRTEPIKLIVNAPEETVTSTK